MKDISSITIYGASSFRKARGVRICIRRRRTEGHLAFTVTTEHSRYIVRMAIESGRALGECVQADSGAPCAGFSRAGHCYHMGRALIFMGKNPIRQ
jgi:hypothetical protein